MAEVLINQRGSVAGGTWHHPPTLEELSGLIEGRIREEVLYREAVSMGLDRDDIIVRRRLRHRPRALDAAYAKCRAGYPAVVEPCAVAPADEGTSAFRSGDQARDTGCSIPT